MRLLVLTSKMNIIYCMSREVTTEEEQTQLLFLVRSAQMTDYFTLRYVTFHFAACYSLVIENSLTIDLLRNFHSYNTKVLSPWWLTAKYVKAKPSKQLSVKRKHNSNLTLEMQAAYSSETSVSYITTHLNNSLFVLFPPNSEKISFVLPPTLYSDRQRVNPQSHVSYLGLFQVSLALKCFPTRKDPWHRKLQERRRLGRPKHKLDHTKCILEKQGMKM